MDLGGPHDQVVHPWHALKFHNNVFTFKQKHLTSFVCLNKRYFSNIECNILCYIVPNLTSCAY